MSTTHARRRRRRRSTLLDPVRSRTLHAAAALLLATAAAAPNAACSTDAAANSSAPAHEGVAPASLDGFDASRVTFAPVQTATRERLVDLPARVVVPPSARHALMPSMPGRIDAWSVAVGDRVEVGDPIATMTSAWLATEDAEVARARASVKAHRVRVSEVKTQVSKGWATRSELADAELAVAEARAELRRAVAERDRRAALAAELPVDNEVVWRAPVAGVVTERSCTVGQLAGVEDRCAEVLDVAAAAVEIQLPEALLARVGMARDAVEGIWTGAGGEEVALQSSWRAPELDPRTRSQRIHLSARDRALLPGSAGRVTVTASAPDGAWRVPEAAVTRIGGESVVFAAADDAGTSATQTTVEVLGRGEASILVRSPELDTTARVATRGVFFLKSLALLGD